MTLSRPCFLKAAFSLTLAIGLISPSSFAQMSLQEAMRTSFEKNPVSQAGDLRIEAAEERARGAWLDMLPSGSVSLSKDFSHSKYNSDGVTVKSKSRNQSWSATLSVNLFRGGADLHSAKAADLNVKALAASNNSTDSRSPHTRGFLASNVFFSYLTLVATRSDIKFYGEQIQILNLILDSKLTADEKLQVQSNIEDLKTKIIQIGSSEKKAVSKFEDYVKVPCPAHLQNFDEIAKSLAIPETAEKAFEIALEKSPELNRAKLDLEIAQHNQAAQKARSYSPSVNAYVQNGGSDSFSLNESRSRGTSAGLSVSIPLGISSSSYNSATAKEIQALHKDFDRILDDMRFEIINDTYPELINAIKLDQLYQERYGKLVLQMNDILKRIESGDAVKLDYILSVYFQTQNLFSKISENKISITSSKFSIQKTIGILFESVGLRIDSRGRAAPISRP